MKYVTQPGETTFGQRKEAGVCVVCQRPTTFGLTRNTDGDLDEADLCPPCFRSQGNSMSAWLYIEWAKKAREIEQALCQPDWANDPENDEAVCSDHPEQSLHQPGGCPQCEAENPGTSLHAKVCLTDSELCDWDTEKNGDCPVCAGIAAVS